MKPTYEELNRIVMAIGQFLEYNTMPLAHTLMPDSETETFEEAIRKITKSRKLGGSNAEESTH